jgi:hypothetical protein
MRKTKVGTMATEGTVDTRPVTALTGRRVSSRMRPGVHTARLQRAHAGIGLAERINASIEANVVEAVAAEKRTLGGHGVVATATARANHIATAAAGVQLATS